MTNIADRDNPSLLPPFAEKVIRKLRRFQECAEDGQGVDIGKQWLDLLTELKLLNRVQRSPALWEISEQGEELLSPSEGSPESHEGSGEDRTDTEVWWKERMRDTLTILYGSIGRPDPIADANQDIRLSERLKPNAGEPGAVL